MPIAFTCPHCGKQTVVADEFGGRSGPCAGCGQTITIPGFAGVQVEAGAPPPPQSASNKWLVPLVIVACSVIPLLACGGILLALLLPAIQAAREAARRTQCNNNLRNIAISLQNYHDTYKVFPAGALHAGMAGESEKLGPSWWYGTLPFTEHRNVYDKIAALQRAEAPGNGAFNAENINANVSGSPLSTLVPEYMRCPSSPLPVMETQTGPIVLPTYVGISGGCDIDASSPDYRGGAAGLVPPISPRPYVNRQKGVGHVPNSIITVSGMLPACQHVGMASCTDGTSNTMIVGEQSDWLQDANASFSTKYHGDAGWDTSGTGPPTPNTTAGGGFISGTAESAQVPPANAGLPGSPPAALDCYNITTVRYRPNYKRVLGTAPLPGCSEDHGSNNPLQSAHPGGLLIGMTDGSVQFLSQTTDLGVLLRLSIRDDGQPVTVGY
ncbi:MAG: DUF1559 domain-containing protein [Planctomycetota bacterium]|nr:DUF1559 domain-containing protein [Planctomycetota bacterium]